MNDILTLDDLSHIIMVKHNMTKNGADKLLNKFLDTIEEGLRTDRYVRIKGFGTFKLIEEDDNNKVIFNKILFVPDAFLKECINRPFAHFESVVLNEDVHFEDIDEFAFSDITVPEKEMGESDVRFDEKSSEKEERINHVCLAKVAEPEITHLHQNNTIENNSYKLTTRNVEKNVETGIEKNTKNLNHVSWCQILFVLILGLILGCIVSWLMFKDDKLIAEQCKGTYIGTGSVSEKDSCILAQEPILQIEAAAITGRKDSLNKLSQDSTSFAADSSNGEEKEVFYSEKFTYRILGTIDSHIIIKGNTLAKIAYKYFGNKKMWPYLVMHNKDKIKDPNNVPIGTKINIPKLEKVE